MPIAVSFDHLEFSIGTFIRGFLKLLYLHTVYSYTSILGVIQRYDNGMQVMWQVVKSTYTACRRLDTSKMPSVISIIKSVGLVKITSNSTKWNVACYECPGMLTIYLRN